MKGSRSLRNGPFRSGTFIFAIALVFLGASIGPSVGEVSGDGGFIPVIAIDVHEPGQNAIIAFDGGVERLYLTVNIAADEMTEGFHVIPFPSMPRISLGSISVFTNITDYMNDSIQERYGREDSMNGGGTTPSIEILLYEKLGEHQVTVIKVEDPTEFKDDLEEVSTFLGINIMEWPEGLDETVQSYVDRDIHYFTIDQYSIGSEDRTMDPLVFEFNSKEAYFPLEISSLFKGQGQIDVTLITPDDLPLDLGPSDRYDQELEFHLTSSELSKIDRSLTERIPGDANVYHLSLKRELSDLKGDLTFPVYRDISSCHVMYPYYTHWRTAFMEDMLFTFDPNVQEIVCLSLPGLERVWGKDYGKTDPYPYPELKILEASGENILLVFDRGEIDRIDMGNGEIIWTHQFQVTFQRDMVVNILMSQNGPLIDVNDVYFLDTDTGKTIPVASVDNMKWARSYVAHGPDDIIAYEDQIGNECYLYSPFNISYFDPRDCEQYDNVSGNIPLYGGSVVLGRIIDDKYLQGRTLDLEEVLNFDNYVRYLDLAGIDEEDLRHRTFCDPDFGIVRVRYPGDANITCYDDETGQVRWMCNIGPWVYPHASFIDIDFDRTVEMYIYDEVNPTQSLVLESDGTKYLQLSEFLPSLPIKRIDDAYLLAGRWKDSFCCFDLTDRSARYYYPLPEETEDHFWDLTVFDWDKDGARVVFGISNDAGYVLYRTGPTGFEYLTTLARNGRVIDLGSTIGISVSGGTISRFYFLGILYTMPYDGTVEKRTYLSIDVPEENMGIDGLRALKNGTGSVAGDPLIAPFIDPATVIILTLLIALVSCRLGKMVRMT